MTVNEFAKEVHENAVAHGWWETARSFPEVAALIHARYEAKKAKNFAEADRIRDELKTQGTASFPVLG